MVTPHNSNLESKESKVLTSYISSASNTTMNNTFTLPETSVEVVSPSVDEPRVTPQADQSPESKPVSLAVDPLSPALKKKATITIVCLVAANILVWVGALISFRTYPGSILSLLALAYTLGLRHAVDADHIAAIDNVTRKLVQDGRDPILVGLFFSLGHSTVVFVVTLIVVATTFRAISDQSREIFGLVGAIVSASFLFLIAIMNLIALVDIWRALRRQRQGMQRDASNPEAGEASASMDVSRGTTQVRESESRPDPSESAARIDEKSDRKSEDPANSEDPRPHQHSAVNIPNKSTSQARDQAAAKDELSNFGFMGRFFGSLYDSINVSWKMYPLGLLFGLGFDTATEVTLLSISVFQAGTGALPPWMVVFLPLLFTAGMSLIDTVDGILMLSVYSWAFINPMRKLYYNLVITSTSVTIAFVIGFIQVLSIIHERYQLEGGFWGFLDVISEHFEIMGAVIVVIFMGSWAFSTVVYRFYSRPSGVAMREPHRRPQEI